MGEQIDRAREEELARLRREVAHLRVSLEGVFGTPELAHRVEKLEQLETLTADSRWVARLQKRVDMIDEGLKKRPDFETVKGLFESTQGLNVENTTRCLDLQERLKSLEGRLEVREDQTQRGFEAHAARMDRLEKSLGELWSDFNTHTLPERDAERGLKDAGVEVSTRLKKKTPEPQILRDKFGNELRAHAHETVYSESSRALSIDKAPASFPTHEDRVRFDSFLLEATRDRYVHRCPLERGRLKFILNGRSCPWCKAPAPPLWANPSEEVS